MIRKKCVPFSWIRKFCKKLFLKKFKTSWVHIFFVVTYDYFLKFFIFTSMRLCRMFIVMSQVMFNQSILVLILEILLLGEYSRALIGCGAGERPWERRQRLRNDSFLPRSHWLKRILLPVVEISKKHKMTHPPPRKKIVIYSQEILKNLQF